MKWGLPVGFSLLFWGFIGIIRYIDEKLIERKKKKEVILFLDHKAFERKRLRVAVCIAARNEESAILKTINSVKRIVPSGNIYIASDGSTDRTAEIAIKSGCNVLMLQEAQGKAGALEMLMKYFNLLTRYKYVMFVDADTTIGRNYLKNALAIFENPEISAIGGYVKNEWRKHRPIIWRYFIIAYRARLYSVLQLFLTYGQTWRGLNVSYIIPGFASIYRTQVLQQLELNVPGIIIEDFNLTFQVRKKKLGLVAHHPSVYGIAQDPGTIRDYARQVSRWNLGFFQTARHYGVWISPFWLSLGVFLLEAIVTAVTFSLIPLLLLAVSLFFLQPYIDLWPLPTTTALKNFFITYLEILAGVFIMDYILTIVIAIKDKRPLLILYGIGFFIFRYIDALSLVTTVPKAFFIHSKGIWVSPKRL